MTNLIQKRKINLNKINLKLAIANVVVLTAFFGAQMLVTVTVGTKTQEISIIRQQKNELRLQNEILLSEIEESKSSLNTKDTAQKYDLVPHNISYIDEGNTGKVALNP